MTDDCCTLCGYRKTVFKRCSDSVIYKCTYCAQMSEEVVTIETGES